MRNSQCVRLGVEALESRDLPAVIAFVTGGGDLVIRGDDAGNIISVNQTDLGPDEFRIIPSIVTTVNGSADPVIMGGVTRNIMFMGGDGNDSFDFTGIVPRHFRYTDRGGDDILVLFTLDVGGSVMINTGRGDDVVLLFEAEVAGKTTVNTGGGNDEVSLIDSVLAEKVRVETGAGVDTFSASTTVFADALIVRGGPGNDTLDAGIADGDDNGNAYAEAPLFLSFETLLS